MNNKNVQVIFKDKSEIIISSMRKILIYENKKRKSLEYPLDRALSSKNSDLTKRLEYTRSLIKTLVRKKQNNEIFYSQPKKKPSFLQKASSQLFFQSQIHVSDAVLDKSDTLNISSKPFRIFTRKKSSIISESQI